MPVSRTPALVTLLPPMGYIGIDIFLCTFRMLMKEVESPSLTVLPQVLQLDFFLLFIYWLPRINKTGSCAFEFIFAIT